MQQQPNREQFIKQLFWVHKGRMSRLPFLFVNVVTKLGQNVLDRETGSQALDFLALVVSFSLIWLSICALAKRFRDIGLSGWFATLYVLWIAGLTLLLLNSFDASPANDGSSIYVSYFLIAVIAASVLALFVWPGQKFDNRYGPHAG